MSYTNQKTGAGFFHLEMDKQRLVVGQFSDFESPKQVDNCYMRFEAFDPRHGVYEGKMKPGLRLYRHRASMLSLLYMDDNRAAYTMASANFTITQ